MNANSQAQIDRINQLSERAQKSCKNLSNFQAEQAAALNEFNSAQSTDGILARLLGRVSRNMARLAGLPQ